MSPIPHSRPTLGPEEEAAVAAVLRSGQLAQGERVSAFEEALAAQAGVGGAAAVSSGTAALHLALLALGIGEGDEVIIPSFVCSALLHAVRVARAVPVPADIDGETLNITPREIQRRQTPRTKAVIVPHLFGLPADIRPIVALGVPVIEDCAQALGSRCEGAPVGGFGVLSVFSFYATKVICTGEGGMVAGNDARLLERIRDLRDYDEKEDDRLRYNCKLTDLQAALGLAQLRRLPELIARRREIAARYDTALRALPLFLPPRPPRCEPNHYRYVVRTGGIAALLAAGREAGIAYRRPVFKPLHRYLGLTGYPETDAAFAQSLSLPIYPSLTEGELNTVIGHLQAACSSLSGAF
jgi:dTDP-4-amino-4,6-dideoxygalactose transaminase